jgi:small-conductance mechanosensitive channel
MTIARRLLLGLLVAAVPAFASEVQDADAEIPTSPVRLEGRVLFTVRGFSSLPASERAALIADRIEDVAADSSIATEDLVVVPAGQNIEIRAGERRLMILVPADAALESVVLSNLAAVHVSRIQQAITDYRNSRQPAYLLRGLGLAMLATALYCALVILLRKAFARLNEALIRRVQAHMATLPSGAFPFVFQGKQVWELATATARGLHWILLTFLLFIWLEFSLAQFPWTRPTSEQLTSIVTDPLVSIGRGFIDFVPSLLFLIVLVIVVRYGLRLVKLLFSALESGSTTLTGFEPEWSMPAYKVIRALAIALALVVAYPYLPGAGSEALQGVSVFAGLLLSLGAAGAVSNIIAGYFNTFGRVYRVGDVIRVGEIQGTVTQVRLLTTRVRTIKNEEVTIPNSTIVNTHVINFSALAATEGLILHTEVGIGYDVPWRQVHAMLEEAARRTPGLLSEPPAFILQRKLGDFAVVYQLNVHSGTARGMAKVHSNLHQHILDVFNEHGVQIMTPAYEGDTAEPKVVPRSEWYAAPAKPPENTAPRQTTLD